MTDLNQAVDAARAFLAGAVPDPTEIRVEEIELSDDDATWWITLSYIREATEGVRDPIAEIGIGIAQAVGVPSIFEIADNARYERVYRRFAVVEGEVRSMTIREFASA